LSRLRRRIGYVPQLLPTGGEMPLTVREVVAMGRAAAAGLGRRLRREDHEQIDQWIDRLGLTPLAGRGFSRVSGGEQRKALIARAMVCQPELLLLDEPTANLDLGWRERIVEQIGALYAGGRLTVVLVCHELEVLPGGCGQILVLDRGRALAAGTPEQVLDTDLVASLYGPGLEVCRRGRRWAVLPGGAE
jgi:ABC-type cobalamin/Fe3+-siderophores transport system ATPase subunit